MQADFFDSLRYTVTSLTRHLRLLLESSPDLRDLWVEGELSNLSRPASGHVYFTLKDAGAQLRCVIWRSNAGRMKYAPAEGILVEAHGSIGVYEAGGQYQFYVDMLRPLGEGTLYAEFLRLKERLEAEGLFDSARKRPLPPFPNRIGVVTSPSGAALRDILDTLRRRFPLVEVVIAPTPVQGSEAPPAIVAAIQRLNQADRPDVILLARGGGSMEDLWAFNDEQVVRAVAGSETPVITGVGHETDFTLVDFAADLRAPTPTAAAELATPLTKEVLGTRLAQAHQALKTATWSSFQQRSERLKWHARRLHAVMPLRLLQDESQHLDETAGRLRAAATRGISLKTARLVGLENRLQSLNPQAVLQRGYSIVKRKADGAVVVGKRQVDTGDEIMILVRDGEFGARVTGEQE